MSTPKLISLTQFLARYRLYVSIFLFGLVVLGVYGYAFPTKYHFSCHESRDGSAIISKYDIHTDTTIDEKSVWVNEDVVVKKYYWGLLYSLDDHKISECSSTDEKVTCRRGNLSTAYTTPKSETPFLFTSFDIVRSQMDKNWLIFKIRNGQIIDYDFTKLQCEKRSKAF